MTMVSVAAIVRESSAAGSVMVTSIAAASPGASARETHSPAGSRSMAPLVSNVRRSITTTRNRSVGARMVARESSTGCASDEIDATTARRNANAGSPARSESITVTARSRSPALSSTGRSTGDVKVGPVTRTVVRRTPSPRSRATITRNTTGAPGPVPATRSTSIEVMRRLMPSGVGSVVARTVTGVSLFPSL